LADLAMSVLEGRQSRKHLLLASISHFDPTAT
jgi:hypothetical protein